jgi:hypothetical protein
MTAWMQAAPNSSSFETSSFFDNQSPANSRVRTMRASIAALLVLRPRRRRPATPVAAGQP